MNKFEFNKLTPFKWFVLENFPFIEADFDALTEWQLFCKLGKEINKIINSENTLGTQMENVTNAFTALQNYVNNYFDNLDIQDEINNKLNEMAESGQLTEIIAQYLQLAGVLAYDTVEDMKKADNLAENSIVKTLGFYNLNDEGGAFYKIRKVTNKDNINNLDIISIENSNDLVAILIKETLINVKQYGAHGNNVNDDINFITTAINNNPNTTIYFPDGNYIISNSIIIPPENEKVVNLKLNKNAIIKSQNKINALIEIAPAGNPYSLHKTPQTCVIEGGILDCGNVNYGIIVKYRNLTEIKNIEFTNISNIGVCLGIDNPSQAIIGNTDLHNCFFYGQGSELENTAIKVTSSDNQIYNIIIDKTKYGIIFDTYGYANTINNFHATVIYNKDATDEQKSNSICILDNSIDYNMFINCYCDTYGIAFKFTKATKKYLTSCKTYWYYSSSDTQFICIDILNFNETKTKINLVNCDFNLPNNGKNIHINCNNSNYTNNDNILCNNCFFNYNNTIEENDIAFCAQVNNKNGVNCDIQDRTLLEKNLNKFYPIAILEGNYSVFDYCIQYTYENYTRICHTMNELLKKEPIKKGTAFQLSLIKQNGKNYLCVSSGSNGKHKNFVLSQFSNNRNCKIFAREDLFINKVFENVNNEDIIFKTNINETL